VSPMRALVITRELVRGTVEREPRAAWAMLEVLAGRLRDD
jgi:CRP-like cAMP-binding protein